MTNKLILGTVQLGLNYGINNQLGKPSLEKAFDILHTAFDNGIRILDTAEAYGDSQSVIGKFHREYPLKKFNIISKLDARSTVENDELLNHILDNIKILNVQKLYGYMFHNYENFIHNKRLYKDILLAKQNGLINNAGISLYANDEVEDIVEHYGEFDFIQIPFNLFDNELKRKKTIEKARKKNIKIHTRSVFLQGLFFKEVNNLPQKIECLESYLNILKEIKQNYKINTETLSLQYVLQKEYIDYVLVGVESSNQLLSNINISKKKNKIPHTIINTIDVKDNDLLNPSNWK